MTCIMRFMQRCISISMCHMVTFWPKNFTQDCFLRFALILCVGATQCVSNTSGGVGGAIKTELLAQVGLLTYFRLRSKRKQSNLSLRTVTTTQKIN